MTLKKSSAKSAVFSVFRTQLYSVRMVLVLFGMILFLLPTVITVGLLNGRDSVDTYIVSQVQNIILGCGLVPLLILALVLAITEFGYLHKKQKLDYFHALPVRRADHYLGRALAALAALAGGALLVCLSQTGVVAAIFGLAASKVYGVIWFSFVMMIFSAFAAYLFAVMVTVLTATLWEMLFSFLAVSAVYPLMAAVTCVIVSYSIPMYELDIGWLELSLFSPFVTGFFALIQIGLQYSQALPVLLVLAAQILVCGVLGFVFFCRRRSEFAESSASQTRFRFVVRFAVTAMAAAAGSMAMLWITDVYAGYLVGAVLGAVLAWIVLELVYTHTFRKLLRSGIPCLTGLACFAVINALVAFGAIGIPEVPDLADINAVSVFCSAQEKHGEQYTLYGRYSGLDSAAVYTDENARYVQMASFDEALIEETRTLMQAVLDDQKACCFPYHPTQYGNKCWSLVRADEESVYNVSISLYTEDGERSYYYRNLWSSGSGKAIFDRAQSIVTSPEYAQSSIGHSLLGLLESITYEDYSDDGYQTYRYSLSGLDDRDAVIERLQEAYMEDLTSTEAVMEREIQDSYVLEFDESRMLTLHGGIVDSYYPADGMECWLAPQYTPGFDPEKVDGYIGTADNLYVTANELPRTFDVLEEIRSELKK